MTGPRRPGLARCTVCDLDVQPGRVTNGRVRSVPQRPRRTVPPVADPPKGEPVTVTVTSCPIGYGNLNGYAHHDCRCPECVEAARAYRRARQVDGAPLGSERFPFAPLEDLVTRRLGPARQGNGVEWVGATDGNCARATAMNTRLWIRCRAAGTIRADHADRAAIALGCHPSEIWPDDWWTK